MAMIRSRHPDLDAFVLDTDFGLGIVTRFQPESMLDYTEEQVEAMTYADLDSNRKEMLNLKPADYLPAFTKTLRLRTAANLHHEGSGAI